MGITRIIETGKADETDVSLTYILSVYDDGETARYYGPLLRSELKDLRDDVKAGRWAGICGVTECSPDDFGDCQTVLAFPFSEVAR